MSRIQNRHFIGLFKSYSVRLHRNSFKAWLANFDHHHFVNYLPRKEIKNLILNKIVKESLCLQQSCMYWRKLQLWWRYQNVISILFLMCFLSTHPENHIFCYNFYRLAVYRVAMFSDFFYWPKLLGTKFKKENVWKKVAEGGGGEFQKWVYVLYELAITPCWFNTLQSGWSIQNLLAFTREFILQSFGERGVNRPFKMLCSKIVGIL